METVAFIRKVKRSFTLSPDSVAFLTATREQNKIASDSEALDMLLRELMLTVKRKQIESAYTAYYDAASEAALAEQQEWAVRSAPSVLIADLSNGADLLDGVKS